MRDILTLYLAGCISERQWQEHLRDELFAAFVRREMNNRKLTN